MDETSYITIGNNRYPINMPISTQIAMDEKSPNYVLVARIKQSWSNMRNMSGTVKMDTVELTDHGKAIFQEYFANGQCDFTVSYTSSFPVRVSSRRRPRPRNTRIQRVQAKRKALDLGQDGKCCYFRTRRASLAFRLAEDDYVEGRRSERPHMGEHEYKTARMRRNEKRQVLKWKPLDYDAWLLSLSDEEKASMEEASKQIALVSDDSPWNALHNLMGVCWAYAREQSSVNRP
jgi:hypothetical protein